MESAYEVSEVFAGSSGEQPVQRPGVDAPPRVGISNLRPHPAILRKDSERHLARVSGGHPVRIGVSRSYSMALVCTEYDCFVDYLPLLGGGSCKTKSGWFTSSLSTQ